MTDGLTHHALVDDVERLRGENALLARCVNDYAAHKNGCEFPNAPACTCGLSTGDALPLAVGILNAMEEKHEHV